MKRSDRAYEIVCELEQHGHPCDCDFCTPLWREVYKMMTTPDAEPKDKSKDEGET